MLIHRARPVSNQITVREFARLRVETMDHRVVPRAIFKFELEGHTAPGAT